MSMITRLLCACVTLATSVAAQNPVPDAAAVRAGTLAGVVHDSIGAGIIGATVSVVGSPGISISADDGAFRLAGIRSGTQVVVARRIGFRPESVTVTVVADTTVLQRIGLRSTAQQVAPMVITSSRVRHTGRMRGFNERRDRGIGRFFTEADIIQRQPRLVTDLLRMVPGVSISPGNGQSVVTFRGRRCAPLVWVDGAPASAGYLDVDTFSPLTLAGIEVYMGPATIPTELHWVRGKSNCGVIALWTKMPEPRGRQGNLVSVKEIEALILAAKLYTVDLVDTPAAQDSAHPIAPVFPDSLFRAATGGRVIVEFVVDINGEPNMSTFSAVLSTHPLFTDAVRRAVATAKFTPAWLGGRRVRQLVQLPIAFSTPGRPNGAGETTRTERGDGQTSTGAR